MKALHVFRGLVLLVSLLVVACATTRTSYTTTYGASDEGNSSDAKTLDRLIQLHASSLDSLKPFIKTFYTGAVRTPAPNLDLREFAHPDSLQTLLQEFCNSATGLEFHPGSDYQQRSYKIIGEVTTKLVEKTEPGPAGGHYHLMSFMKLDSLKGAHLKPYYWFEGVNWEKTFKKLDLEIRSTRADAVIEIFIGKGLETQYVAPSYHQTPGMYNPMTGMYQPGMAYSAPAVVSTSEWKLYGLLIEWTEDAPSDSVDPPPMP
ncbi:hypothetical protein GF324_00085 [bacterium]|nr:hypothetical protein [bacterium]